MAWGIWRGAGGKQREGEKDTHVGTIAGIWRVKKVSYGRVGGYLLESRELFAKVGWNWWVQAPTLQKDLICLI